MDAHILKWHPYANMIGCTPPTARPRDGTLPRYRRRAFRAAHRARALPSEARRLYGLRRRHGFLAPLIDAEYPLATFVAVTRPAELELRVSSTGLLIRKAGSIPDDEWMAARCHSPGIRLRQAIPIPSFPFWDACPVTSSTITSGSDDERCGTSRFVV